MQKKESVEVSLEEEKIDYEGELRKFLRDYSTVDMKFKYYNKIKEMIDNGENWLVVDWSDIYKYNNKLAIKLKKEPDLMLTFFNLALKSVVSDINPDYLEEKKDFFVRIVNIPEIIAIRNIKSDYINQLITIEGILVRVTPVKEKMIRAKFKHAVEDCNQEFYWPPEGEIRDFIEQPATCPICGKSGNIKLVPEKSQFVDWQKIVVQERPEEIPSGQIPRSIEVVLTRDLVDRARPGDRVSIVGILRVVPPQSRVKPVYDLMIEANSVTVSQKTLEEVEITREDEEKIVELSKDPWIRKKIISSIAPTIYGHWDEKEAIALALFGGVPKESKDKTRIRGDIHVLLVGDPGTAKSQLLQFVSRIAPRAIYTTGKGSSAAGLTAAVIRDKKGGDFYLEAGAMVLADGGVACIDEIDKMREEDRVAIHEAMEQQSYHPDTIVELSDGRKVAIGTFVEELMAENKGYLEYVGDTIYLRKVPEFLKLKTTDFITVFNVIPKVISKHKAPSHFYKITYSNGYSIIVTPEHPVFVLTKSGIEVVRADTLKEGSYVPGSPNTKDSSEYPEEVLRVLFSKLFTTMKCPRPYTGFREEIRMLLDSCKNNLPREMLKMHSSTITEIEKFAGISWHKVVSVEKIENNSVDWVYDITIEPTRRFLSNDILLHNTVSIAKAGIVAKLNARAAVIAAGNPKYGRYVEEKTVADNINLPVTILSRFDLIFILKDKPSAEYDSMLAQHILQVHKDIEQVQPEIPIDLLKKYISYAKRFVKPTLTEEANNILRDFFVQMRKIGSESQSSVVSITPRQLEALIRLAEAHAKMALKNEVTEEDALEAIRLMKVFMQQAGLMTESGVVDIDAIMIGKPKSKRDKIILIEDTIKEILNETGEECANIKAILERVQSEGIEKDELEELLSKMYREGILIQTKYNCYRTVS